MVRLSMMSLRKLGAAWPILFVLSLPAGLPAQTPGQVQPATQASFEQLKATAAGEVQNGENAQAIGNIQRALAMQPDWKEGWWNLGTLQYEANQYPEAAQALQKVVEFAPRFGTAWALLGLCEFELKQYGPALAHLENAQTLGLGDDAETARVASYHLTLLRIRQGQFERGTELLHSAFGSGPPSSQIQLALGLALLRVPLLPDEVDPSKDALLRAAGGLASTGPDSVEGFTELLQSYPTTPYIHYAYGLRLKETGRWKEALAQQHEEAELSPQSALPWIEISDLETRLGHRGEAASASQRAKALDSRLQSTLPDSSSRDPRMITLYKGSGGVAGHPETTNAGIEGRSSAMRNFSAGHYSDAIAELKPWLIANPADGTSWAVLGLSEFALKEYENAQIHLERGEQLGLSGSADAVRQAKYTLGVLLIRSGAFDHASEVLSSAAGAGSLQQELQFASGLALLRIRKLPEDVKPDGRELIAHAGEIAQLLFASRYDEADPKFEALLKQYPRAPFLHYAYGTALLAISQYQEAKAQMRAEIAISPNSELPYVRLASIALRQQQPGDAIEPAEHAIQLAADSAEAHYLLGRAALQLGDSARSVRELEIACRLAPSSPEAHFNLAKAYAKAGQSQKSEQERTRFTELNAVADARKRQGNQVYQGPHDAIDMSVSHKPAGSTVAPN
jgi:tetratricopeptide (TPR) repeat protein